MLLQDDFVNDLWTNLYGRLNFDVSEMFEISIVPALNSVTR